MRAERKRLAGLDAMAADRAASIHTLPPSDLVAVYWAIGSELGAEPIARAWTPRAGPCACPS